MIEGVKVKKLVVHQDVVLEGEKIDQPGFLMEVLRNDDGLIEKLGQTVFTLAYPGTIKAFHWHKDQADVWFFASGKAQVVLYDLREDSSTYQKTDVFYLGEDNPCLLFIPPKVAHGYQVLSDRPAMLFYHTDQLYDSENPDEERISFDDPKIGFDWTVKKK